MWKAAHRNDAMVIPIIYNYRHGVELALKEGIREAARCVRRGGVTSRYARADVTEEWPSATHSIQRLTNRLTRLLRELRLGPGQELPGPTREVLRKLHVLGHDGQAFRYSMVKTGQQGQRVLVRVRPGEQQFDLVAVAEALSEAGAMLLGGVSGVLGEYSDYSDYQDDMADWSGARTP